jgi:hypothetical protein
MNFVNKSVKLFSVILCTVILLQTAAYSQNTTETTEGDDISAQTSASETTSTATPTTIQTITPTLIPTPAPYEAEATIEIPEAVLEDLNRHWAAESILRLYREKIINGYGDGKIRPDDTINRNEVSVILYKLLGAGGDNSLDIYFNDKDLIPEWVKPCLSVLYNYGIMNGFEDNTFRGNKSFTRAEAAVVLIKTLNCLNREIISESDKPEDFIPQEITKYKDYNKKHWANFYLDKAIAKDLMKGYADGVIRPDQNITRAEFFSMCANLLDLSKKE